MATALQQALCMFQVAPVAEEGAESIHRDVAGELARAHGSRIAFLSATTRIEENMQLCTRYVSQRPQNEATFNRLWATQTG